MANKNRQWEVSWRQRKKSSYFGEVTAIISDGTAKFIDASIDLVIIVNLMPFMAYIFHSKGLQASITRIFHCTTCQSMFLGNTTNDVRHWNSGRVWRATPSYIPRIHRFNKTLTFADWEQKRHWLPDVRWDECQDAKPLYAAWGPIQ